MFIQNQDISVPFQKPNPQPGDGGQFYIDMVQIKLSPKGALHLSSCSQLSFTCFSTSNEAPEQVD